MLPRSRKIALLSVSAIAASLAVFNIVRAMSGSYGEDLNRVVHFECGNEVCGEPFSMTLRMRADWLDRDPGVAPETLAELYAASVCGIATEGKIFCPQCGSYKIAPAYPCDRCGEAVRLSGHGKLPETCPHCGERPIASRSRDAREG